MILVLIAGVRKVGKFERTALGIIVVGITIYGSIIVFLGWVIIKLLQFFGVI